MTDCQHVYTWFDRNLCAVCTSMHYICTDCGTQTDPCGPDRWADHDEVVAIARQIAEDRKDLMDRLANPPVDWEKEYDMLWQEYTRAQQKLDKIRTLYRKRCDATVDVYTDGEEMLLADLSAILEGEDEQSIQDLG